MRRTIILGLLLFSLVIGGCQLFSGNSKKTEEPEKNLPRSPFDEYMRQDRPKI